MTNEVGEPATYRDDQIAELEKDLGEAVALLRELEWAGSEVNTYNEVIGSTCHECAAREPGPHAPDCKLAAFLRRHP